jgi:hypothetical protein
MKPPPPGCYHGRECRALSGLSTRGVIGANGAARRKVALRAAEVRPARDEMASTPSREDDGSSEIGAR